MKNTDVTKEIVGRFFEALDALIAAKVIRGTNTYCVRYEIDRRNLIAQRKDLDRGWFQVSWLYPMVTDFGISAKWLLTGKGKMFSKTL